MACFTFPGWLAATDIRSVALLRRTPRGATLLQLLVVLSIISSLLILVTAGAPPVKQSIVETQCRQRLYEIGGAIARYQDDHGGQDPPGLSSLAPDYLSEEKLVCPLVLARAPNAVERAREKIRARPSIRYWPSYFYFNRRAIDGLYGKGISPLSYTHVMQARRGETPVVACLDHREPWSLATIGAATPAMERSWYSPERPILVLRRDGTVGISHYGGVRNDALEPDTLALLLHL